MQSYKYYFVEIPQNKCGNSEKILIILKLGKFHFSQNNWATNVGTCEKKMLHVKSVCMCVFEKSVGRNSIYG